MFDFAWSEIALIGVVALVAIGPKDMPVAIKTLSELVKKARRMAGEFQTHVDEMVRDANLHEVRDHIKDIRSLNIRGTIARAVDADGSIRRAFTENPLDAPAGAVPQTSPAASTVDAAVPPTVIGLPDSSEAQASLAALQPSMAVPGLAAPEASAVLVATPAAVIPPPAFIPPAAAIAAVPVPVAPVPPPAFVAPAFIPPAVVLAEASPVPAASGAAPAG